MAMNLTRDSSISLHEQLKLELYTRIDAGVWKPGMRIPSERELCDTYQVSRITVRQAIADAVAEGRLYRQHGKGTFVSRPHVEQGLSRIVTFSSTMQGLGMNPSTRVLASSYQPADMLLAKVLDVPAGHQVVNLQLLGLGNEEPMVLYDSLLPHTIGNKLLPVVGDWIQQGKAFSTYELYNRSSGVFPKFCEQTLEAVAASNELAALLKVKPMSPLFLITTVFYSTDHKPIEFRKAYYRGEFYRFHLDREFT